MRNQNRAPEQQNKTIHCVEITVIVNVSVMQASVLGTFRCPSWCCLLCSLLLTLQATSKRVDSKTHELKVAEAIFCQRLDDWL